MDITDYDIEQIRLRLGAMISELYPGLFDSPEDLLEDMLGFAKEAYELQLEGDGKNPGDDEHEFKRETYDRVVFAIRILTGDQIRIHQA